MLLSQNTKHKVCLAKAPKDALCCRYENIVQVRCLLEGESVDKILNEWHELLPAYMDKWKLDRSQVDRLNISIHSRDKFQKPVCLPGGRKSFRRHNIQHLERQAYASNNPA